MIEFKGECGHTIRARDEDKGKLVRCTYCGRETLVPSETNDELDSLFNEVERTGVYDPQATRSSHKSHRRTKKQAALGPDRIAKGFDPFAVALKMTYIAVFVIAAVAVYKFAVPAVRDVVRDMKTPSATPTASNVTTLPAAAPTDAKSAGGHGLRGVRLRPSDQGIYVRCVPAVAEIYTLPRHDDVGAVFAESGGKPAENRTDNVVYLAPGNYMVALAVRINDPRLMQLPGYSDQVRRPIESGNALPVVIDTYFVPDGSIASQVVELRGLRYLARVFEVTVFTNLYQPVTALFLPRAVSSVNDWLTMFEARDNYNIREDQFRSELDYYGIPPGEQEHYLLAVLRHIGCVVYPTDDGYRFFSVHLEDGAPVSRLLDG